MHVSCWVRIVSLRGDTTKLRCRTSVCCDKQDANGAITYIHTMNTAIVHASMKYIEVADHQYSSFCFASRAQQNVPDDVM